MQQLAAQIVQEMLAQSLPTVEEIEAELSGLENGK